MYWLRFIYSLRGERWLGPYLLPIFSSIHDTGAFFLLTSLCIAASTHAYIILGPRREDTYSVYSAFTHTFRLAMLGDFDIFEYQGQDTVYEQNAEQQWEPNDPSPKDLEPLAYIYLQGLLLCTSVGIQVLLMNLLIGILGQNYGVQQGRAQVLFVQARARMLLQVQRRPWSSRTLHWLRFGHKTGARLFTQTMHNIEWETRQKFEELPWICRFCTRWGILAVFVPLQYMIGNFNEEPQFEYSLLERVTTRMVLTPVVSRPCFSLLFLAISFVLMPLSLLSLLVFRLVAMVLRILGIKVLSSKFG